MVNGEAPWTCAFCGRPGQRSKEHILAQCLEEILPEAPTTHVAYGIGVGLNATGDAYSPMPTEDRRTARKKILDRVTRDVCTTCNSGWMGALDEAAKPIIARLLDAGRGAMPERLSKSDARILTSWAVKTAWTNELANAGDKQRELLLTTQAEREALGRGELPSRTRLWLARYEGTVIEIAQGHGLRDRHSPPLECETPGRYVGTAMNLGGVVFLLYTGEVGGFFPALGQDQLAMVWPNVLGAFPPRAATGEELRTVVTSFGHWVQAHPRPYDSAGVAEFIGPRPIRKQRLASAKTHRGAQSVE